MKVHEVYRHPVKTCTPVTSLDAVGKIMWEGDCGAVPVVDSEGKALGILTDRDLAMAMAAKNRGSAQIIVRELTSEKLFSCTPDDDVAAALKTMQARKVRRLPVVDAQGQLLGLLSLKDIALAAKPGSGLGSGDVSHDDIALTMQAVCKRLEGGERPKWPWVNAASR